MLQDSWAQSYSHLISALKPDQTVIMDNASFHKFLSLADVVDAALKNQPIFI
ncbi:hypothetical protein MIDIC_110050 [Alphaproteobacteria bacterium]